MEKETVLTDYERSCLFFFPKRIFDEFFGNITKTVQCYKKIKLFLKTLLQMPSFTNKMYTCGGNGSKNPVLGSKGEQTPVFPIE